MLDFGGENGIDGMCVDVKGNLYMAVRSLKRPGIWVADPGHHPGILVVRQDNDPTRDLTPKGIVSAIRKLEAANVPIQNEFIILNHWR